MLLNLFQRVFILSSVFLLLSCRTASHSELFPEITFNNLPGINLDVAKIKVVSNFKRDFSYPNVVHQIPLSPELALTRWARDRLTKGGRNNVAQLTITHASAKEISLKTDTSVIGMFKNQQSHRFEAIIGVTLEVLNENNAIEAFVRGKAIQTITVSEATSLSDRRQIWYNLVEKLIKKFNNEIEPKIKEQLGPHLL